MGVFSTLEIYPQYCPHCGELHKSVQSKAVGYCEHYKIGEKVSDLHGYGTKKYIILKDEFICFGKGHDEARAMMLNLGKQTLYPKGNPWNTYVQYMFSCFKNKVYLGTTLNLDDAYLLLEFPSEEETDLHVVY